MREAAVRGLLSLFTECGDYVKSRFPLTSFCLVMILGLSGRGTCQTFDVNGQSPPNSKQSANTAGSPRHRNDFSWGSGIQVARQARAAQAALKRKDFAGAVSYAEQAASSAAP